MRVSSAAICTLAALAAGYGIDQAQAAPSLPSSPTDANSSDVLVPVKTNTPALVENIAPPETVVAQQFSDNPQSGVRYYQEYQNTTVVTTEDSAAGNITSPQQPLQQEASTPAVAAVKSNLTSPDASSTPASSAPVEQAVEQAQARRRTPRNNRPTRTPPNQTRPNRTPTNNRPATPPRPPSNPPAAPVPPPDTSNLVVVATEVRVAGATEELQQIVQQVIKTRVGGETSQSQLQQDVNAILNTGLFTNVSVNTSSTSGGLSVVYQVQPVVVQSIQLEGARALTLDVALERFQPQFGSPISPTALRQSVQEVNKWYADNGYNLARVLSIRPERNGVLVLNVAEGVVGNVKFRFVDDKGKPVDDKGKPIEGRTRIEFLQREVKTQPGQIFRESQAQQDILQLYRLGLFENVTVALEGDANKVDVVYQLVEAPARSVNFGGGYSSERGLSGTVSYRDRNVGGVANSLGVNVDVSARDVEFDGNYTSPYRASAPDTLGYRAGVFRRRVVSNTFDGDLKLPDGSKVSALPNDQNIREGRFGGSFALQRPIDGWNASLGLNYTRVSLRDRDGDIVKTDRLGNPLSISGTGIDDLTTVSFNATKDQRDNPVNPTQGSVLTLSSEQSIPIGLGNIAMNRLRANYIQYVPVSLFGSKDPKEPEVLAVNLQGGTVIGDLPPYEAFNLGGGNSVRGYGEGDVASGRSYVLASAEYRFPIFQPVGGVLFADFASDLGSGDTVLGEPGVVRGKPGTGFGYGAGVRVQSPIGLIRADYGINDQGEGRFQFGIGQRF
jgi:outer membrane protein insertion porin family